MKNTSAAGPLAHVRVLDFGQYIAGPGAGMLLADQGADVIKVEMPGGPAMRSPANAVLNRGKRAVVLNLKNPAGVEEARRLVTGADILIENFLPGTMARLGLGAQELTRLNPGLIYLSLPGFSAEDAQYAGMPAWEGVIAAAMGQFTDMGLNRVLMGIQASYSPITLASAYGAVFGTLAVVLALRHRERNGQGDVIEVPLAAALMEGLAYNSLHVENLPDRYKSLREREIERRRANALPMNLNHDQLQMFLDPFYRTYICKDGRPFYVVSEAHASHSIRALKVLGIWDEIQELNPPLSDPYRPMRDWDCGATCTLKAYPISEPWASFLTRRMAAAFLEKDSQEWQRLFGEAGAPAAAHLTTAEWLKSKHPKDAGLLVEVSDPDFGTMTQPGPLAWLSSSPPEIRPRTTEPGRDWLARTISTEAGAKQANTTEGWLEGIMILDMTNVIAGPTIAGVLARFGARVIKLDHVSPTFDPWNTIICGIYSNQGKESMLVDVKSPDGYEVLQKLIQKVDVITINASARQLPEIGLTYSQIKKVNPKAILCHLDAFGGPGHGDRSNYPGYDDLVQASTGIMERFGGSLNTVEEHAHFGTIDVLGGVAAAFAVAVALRKRDLSGEGDIARTSLAAAGQWLQSRFMYDYQNRPPFDEPRGREVKGEGPFYRCYKASDRWFFFAIAPRYIAALASSDLLGAVLTVQEADREEWLESVFSTRSVKEWQAHLKPFHAAVQPLATMSAVRGAAIVAADKKNTVGFARVQNHPSSHAIEHVLPTAIRSKNSRIAVAGVAEKYGHSTAAVLTELGYADRVVEELVRKAAVGVSWSDSYLPD